MSSGVEVAFILPYLNMPAGAGMAASGAGFSTMLGSLLAAGASIGAVGGLAYAASQHMEAEYQATLQACRDRCEAERFAAQSYRSAQDSALGLAKLTQIKAAENADAAFLLAGVDKLLKQLGAMPDGDPRLPDGCVALRGELLEQPADCGAHYQAYASLSEAVAARAVQHNLAKLSRAKGETAKAIRARLEVELEAVAAQLQSPLFDESRSPGVRLDLEKRLGEVRGLALEQPAMSEQALKLLRARVHRELGNRSKVEQGQRQKEEKQAARAARLRELTAHVAARARVSMRAVEAPELAHHRCVEEVHGQAEALLHRLAQVVAAQLPDDLAPLQKLAGEADTLYQRTQRQLEEIAVQSYLESQVSNVFAELGYNVTVLPGSADGASDGTLLATVDSQFGVELSIDSQGNFKSEMVAFSEKAAEVNLDSQERACALMDDVFDALRGRGHQLREKKRRHLKPVQHRLRVVERVKQSSHEAAGEASAAPLQRKADS